MFIRKNYKHILAALLVSISSVPTIHASALFDGDTADAWLIDTETGQAIGYNIGRWLEQYESSDYPGIVLDANSAILVNHIHNSSVPMTLGQPSVSLAGIGDAALLVGESDQGGFTDVKAIKVVLQTLCCRLRVVAMMKQSP